ALLLPFPDDAIFVSRVVDAVFGEPFLHGQPEFVDDCLGHWNVDALHAVRLSTLRVHTLTPSHGKCSPHRLSWIAVAVQCGRDPVPQFVACHFCTPVNAKCSVVSWLCSHSRRPSTSLIGLPCFVCGGVCVSNYVFQFG